MHSRIVRRDAIREKCMSSYFLVCRRYNWLIFLLFYVCIDSKSNEHKKSMKKQLDKREILRKAIPGHCYVDLLNDNSCTICYWLIRLGNKRTMNFNIDIQLHGFSLLLLHWSSRIIDSLEWIYLGLKTW